jgi:hypothetical protein
LFLCSPPRGEDGEGRRKKGEEESARASPPHCPAGVEDPEVGAARELEEAIRDEAVPEHRSHRITAIPADAFTPTRPSLLHLHLRTIISLSASFS